MPIISHTAGGGGGAPGGGDSTYTDTYANIPAASNDGDLFFPSDGFSAYRDTGAAWASWGPLHPFTTPPAVATFTWVNQGGATAVETYGGIHLYAPSGAGNNTRALVVATGGTPWVVTLSYIPHTWGVNYNVVGVIVRESGTNEEERFFYNGNYQIGVNRMTNPTTYNSTPFTELGLNRPSFWRVSDDGTNRSWYVSPDGQNWYLTVQYGRTTFLTADEVGIFVESNHATWAVGLTLLSWEKT